MKIIWIQFSHLENTLKPVHCGSVTFFQHPQLSLMLCIFKMSSKKDCKRDKREKLVFARFVKNYLPNALMNWSAKSQSSVQNEVSCWSVSVMKSKWLFKLIRLYTKAQLRMECVKHWWLNKAKMKWIAQLRRSKTQTKNSQPTLKIWNRILRTKYVKTRKSNKDFRRLMMIRLNICRTLTTTSRKNLKLYCLPLLSERFKRVNTLNYKFIQTYIKGNIYRIVTILKVIYSFKFSNKIKFL